MNNRFSPIVFAAALCAFIATPLAHAQTAPPALNINAAKVNGQVSPNLYGLMTEEINYSYDGGLYGELIRNRVFKGAETPGGRRGAAPATAPSGDRNLAHWSVATYSGGTATIAIDTANPLNDALGNSLKLDASSLAHDQRVGIANDGYWGIPVRPSTIYRASFYARCDSASAGPLSVAIENSDGSKVFAQAAVGKISGEWKQYNATLQTTADAPTTADTRFVVSTGTPGVYWFNLVSLFPPTYNDRPNGNRIDIMQKLVDMKPRFLRFPGGNYLEGNDKENIFDWKKTVGPLASRPTHLSPWNYRSDDGMGLLEFLEWTEDMHAQPVLAVFAGYTLGGRFVATGDAMKPYVQDALDEIEYVTGDASTKWGAQRIADGHPAPFPLNYIEVGNEDNLGQGPRTYEDRFGQIYDAVKAKYPNIKIIATAKVNNRTADLIDEHHYPTSSEEAIRLGHEFDKLDRSNKTKIFVGEWATRIGSPTTNLKAGLADAAYLVGIERNSDFVQIFCYAPMFVNVNPAGKYPGGMQWASDLIGYNALTSYGCPSYYVQAMFSNNIGDQILDTSFENVPTVAYIPPPRGGRRGAAGATGATPPAPAPAVQPIQLDQIYEAVTKDSATGIVYLKVVNVSGLPQPVQINIAGAGSIGPDAQVTVLSSADSADTNTIDEPTKVAPVNSTVSGVSASFSHTFPAYSVTVMRIATK